MVILGFVAFLGSCQIEKQYHSAGYRVQWTATGKRNYTPKSISSPHERFTQKNTHSTSSKNHKNNEEKQQTTFENINHPQVGKISKQTENIEVGSVTRTVIRNNRKPVFPPDTVVVYDTVYEEEIMILPDSIKSKYDSLLEQAEFLRKKSTTPTIVGYLLLSFGGSAFFLAALFLLIALSFRESILGSLIAMGVSLILLIGGSITINRGLKMQSTSRKLIKEAKALIAPYVSQTPAVNRGESKKSNKRWILYASLIYLALQAALNLI